MAGKEDLKLLGSPVSPFAIRARMALNVKRVSYEYIDEDIFNKSDLRSSNPVHRKVPILIHNGRPICESLVIVQYVDQALGGSTAQPAFLPADPYDRAIAMFGAHYIDHKMFLEYWRGIMKAKTLEEKLLKARQSSAKMKVLEEEVFIKCSKGKAFFGGESIGYLDLALGSYMLLFEVIHKIYGVEIMDAGNTPLLAAWAARFKETVPVKEATPKEDRMVAHVKKVYVVAGTPVRL